MGVFKATFPPSIKRFKNLSLLSEDFSRFRRGIYIRTGIKGIYANTAIKKVLSKLNNAILTPAKAGPITLEPLKDAEFNPTALDIKFLGTTTDTNTSLTGW